MQFSNANFSIYLGASASIGLAICKNLVENGLIVCAVAKKSGVAKLDVMSSDLFC